MTTNKVHDPKNTECEIYGDIHESEVECEHPCTCEKQQQAPQENKCENCERTSRIAVLEPCPFCSPQEPTPTSVTGEEWEEEQIAEFEEIYGDYLEGEFCCSGRECACGGDRVKDFVYRDLRKMLLAQRTHIKQALLGRSKKLKRKYSNDLALDENNLIHKLETVDDTELFINEELA